MPAINIIIISIELQRAPLNPIGPIRPMYYTIIPIPARIMEDISLALVEVP